MPPISSSDSNWHRITGINKKASKNQGHSICICSEFSSQELLQYLYFLSLSQSHSPLPPFNNQFPQLVNTFRSISSWCVYLIFFKISMNLILPEISLKSGVINKADVFLEFSCLFENEQYEKAVRLPWGNRKFCWEIRILARGPQLCIGQSHGVWEEA